MTPLRRLIFNLWYLGRPPWDSGISPPELMEFLDSRPVGRAIDLGCGTGTNALTLARRGWQVVGVDFAGRAIKSARRKLQAAGVQADLREGDVTRLDGVAGPFDLALDVGCFHGMTPEDKGLYLANLDRLLAPHGFWFMYAFIAPANPEAEAGGGRPATGPGVSAADLELIRARLKLVYRQDGFDSRRERPSAYFIHQKP